ncbi:hypothetical protein [Nocardioides mesophilus]|uniref:ATP-binding protein n=1 Tax=Nocardioides mesophilus TaxID=433659 RepID=A0A7G9RG93_9ACTN|nr:hypothetical protein [Nocardioides mesophilus]QNN54618.1 hypothetical protein H9L09_10110 [Nocardioides mesophilus]
MTTETPGTWQIRQLVRQNLCRSHAGHLELDACVVATELVTDARSSGPASLAVSLECWQDSLLIALEDRSTSEVDVDPQRQYLSKLLIDRLTTGWGVDELPDGRRLWAVISTAQQSFARTASGGSQDRGSLRLLTDDRPRSERGHRSASRSR